MALAKADGSHHICVINVHLLIVRVIGDLRKYAINDINASTQQAVHIPV